MFYVKEISIHENYVGHIAYNKIDIIALKDNIEKGRILGIITPVNHTKILMVLSFDGKRPEAINDENFEQTLILYKTE